MKKLSMLVLSLVVFFGLTNCSKLNQTKNKFSKDYITPESSLLDGGTLATIIEVIDGATLKIKTPKGEKIHRIKGMNAPASMEGKKLEAQIASCGMKEEIIKLGINSKTKLKGYIGKNKMVSILSNGQIYVYGATRPDVGCDMVNKGYVFPVPSEKVKNYSTMFRNTKNGNRGFYQNRSLNRAIMFCLETVKPIPVAELETPVEEDITPIEPTPEIEE